MPHSLRSIQPDQPAFFQQNIIGLVQGKHQGSPAQYDKKSISPESFPLFQYDRRPHTGHKGHADHRHRRQSGGKLQHGHQHTCHLVPGLNCVPGKIACAGNQRKNTDKKCCQCRTIQPTVPFFPQQAAHKPESSHTQQHSHSHTNWLRFQKPFFMKTGIAARRLHGVKDIGRQDPPVLYQITGISCKSILTGHTHIQKRNQKPKAERNRSGHHLYQFQKSLPAQNFFYQNQTKQQRKSPDDLTRQHMRLNDPAESKRRKQPIAFIFLLLHIPGKDLIKSVYQKRQKSHCRILSQCIPVVNIIDSVRCKRIEHTSDHTDTAVLKAAPKAFIGNYGRSQIHRKHIGSMRRIHIKTQQAQQRRKRQKGVAVKDRVGIAMSVQPQRLDSGRDISLGNTLSQRLNPHPMKN